MTSSPQSPAPTSAGDSQSLVDKLLHYEACSRQSDADFHATCAHLWPMFATLQSIGQKHDKERVSTDRIVGKKRKSSRTRGFFGLGSSRGASSSRSIGSVSSAASSADVGEPQNKGQISYECIASAYKIFAGGHDECSSYKAGVASNVELIKADRQLMYMLQQLSSKLINNERTNAGTKTKTDMMTFPEFVQCYRFVVCGMQTMQHLCGNTPTAIGDFRISEEDVFRLKKRTADRIAGMISMFGPNAYNAGGNMLLRTPTRAPSRKTSPSPSVTKSSGGSGIFPAKLFASSIVDTSDDDMETAGELEEEIDYLRRLLAVKDKQLLRALNDHADNVESLGHEASQRDEAIRRYIRRKRRRRKRLRRMLVVSLICAVLVCYEIGVIKVDVANRIPRPSLHLDAFAHVFGSVSNSEVRALKQSNWRKEYQIQNLEKKIDALEAESKKTKASLELSRELALDSCRAEMSKVREEAAILRLGRSDKYNRQHQSYMKFLRKYLLGPFHPTDEV